MRKRKKRMIIIVAAELLFIVCGFVFLLGHAEGTGTARTKVQVSVMEEEPIYLNGPEEQNPLKVEVQVSNTQVSDSDDQVEENKDVQDIILVNKDNRLPEDYSVTLKTLPDGVNQAAEEAHGPLCDMLKAGRREGLYFEICSSYRSVERQQELLDEDITDLIRRGYTYQEAYLEVTKETMPPGHSEHSTGLAFDIVSLGYQMLDAGQEQTAENKWLQEHCAEYGFILRYPKGKEEITKINYESWHFRYVGVEMAEYIMEKGISLEEYLEAEE